MVGLKIENDIILTAEGTTEELQEKGYQFISETMQELKKHLNAAERKIIRKKFTALSVEELENPTEEIYKMEKCLCGILPDFEPGKYIAQQKEHLKRLQKEGRL